MTPNPETTRGELTVAEFLSDVAMLRRHSAFPLLDSAGSLQGMVTLNRLRSVPVHRRTMSTSRDVTCPKDEIPLAEPHEPLSSLLSRMDGCADGRALVLTDGHLTGIVSSSDISRGAAAHSLAGDRPDQKYVRDVPPVR